MSLVSLSVLPVARWVRVLARRHRVRITPAPIAPLDANLPAAQFANAILRRALGLALLAVDALRRLDTGPLHSPALTMLHNVTIILGHNLLGFRLTTIAP